MIYYNTLTRESKAEEKGFRMQKSPAVMPGFRVFFGNQFSRSRAQIRSASSL